MKQKGVKRAGLAVAAVLFGLIASCAPEKEDPVFEGKGTPASEKEIVVKTGTPTVPALVIDDKGNPVLNDDGTPKQVGDKAEPDYNGSLPKALEGSWAINAADCERGSGETRIRVGPHNVVFYEAQAEVKKIDRAGEITIADMEIMSEGETIKEQHKFSLADGGATLVYDRGGEVYRYGRCAT